MVLAILKFMLELWSKLALHFHYTSNYPQYYHPDCGITKIVLKKFLGLFGCSAHLGLPCIERSTTICGRQRPPSTHAPSMLIKLSKSKTWGEWGENREKNPEHNWEHNLGQNYFREEKNT